MQKLNKKIMPGLNLRPKGSEIIAMERRGYEFGNKIGKGSYGFVVKASYKDQSSEEKIELACKYVDKRKAPKDFLEKFFPREIKILTKVSHRNIIGIHSILQSGNKVFIFMRWAENGDLLDYIKKNGIIPESQANLWFYQMASAIKYIHSMNYAHRDMKCENILISKHMNIKIADFGFATSCSGDDNKKFLSETFCGSAAYAPPEIINASPYEPKLADIWSLGIILFVMLNALMPFDDTYMGKLIRDQRERRYHIRDDVEEKLTQDCKTMLYVLLEPDPKLRVNIEGVYRMKWLAKTIEKHDN
ncbi:CLUMA_CG019436, isoform A [Clunio marinus]|uniref:CLUMA_CG019436, isoform A n=1 Tax=Clunio marinus TaxID=568069 RepID=A0A1J1J493_9DIPT|nr:CLUMA_CG019436, isoform A [Clunio marinus]